MTNETFRRRTMNNYGYEYNDYESELDALEEFASKYDYSFNAENKEGVPFWKEWDGNKYFNNDNQYA